MHLFSGVKRFFADRERKNNFNWPSEGIIRSFRECIFLGNNGECWRNIRGIIPIPQWRNARCFHAGQPVHRYLHACMFVHNLLWRIANDGVEELRPERKREVRVAVHLRETGWISVRIVNKKIETGYRLGGQIHGTGADRGQKARSLLNSLSLPAASPVSRETIEKKTAAAQKRLPTIPHARKTDRRQGPDRPEFGKNDEVHLRASVPESCDRAVYPEGAAAERIGRAPESCSGWICASGLLSPYDAEPDVVAAAVGIGELTVSGAAGIDTVKPASPPESAV